MYTFAAFLVETYQGSFVPVTAVVHRIDEIGDCALTPLSYTMPFVELSHAQEFLRDNVPTDVLMYETPVKMNPQGLKWLSEVENAQ